MKIALSKTYKKTRKLFVLLVVLLCLNFNPVLSATWNEKEKLSSLETQFIKIENIDNPKDAVDQWIALLDDIKSNTAHPVITQKLIRNNIIQSYISIYKNEKDDEAIVKAQKFVRSWDNNQNKSWALIALLNAMAYGDKIQNSDDTYSIAQDLIDDIEEYAFNINDLNKRSRVFYGLSLVIVENMNSKNASFKNDVAILVQNFLPHIRNIPHKQQIYKKYAKIITKNPSIVSKKERDLLKLLGQKQVNLADLQSFSQKAYDEGDFDLALNALINIPDKKDRPRALNQFFILLMDKEEYSRARRVADSINNPAKGIDTWSKLGRHYYGLGYIKQGDEAFARASSYLSEIDRPESLEKAKTLIRDRRDQAQKKTDNGAIKPNDSDKEKRKKSLSFSNEGELVKATILAREIEHPIYRTKTFRQIAEQQALKNDKYDVLSNQDNTDKSAQNYILNQTKKISFPDQKTVEELENNLMNGLGKNQNEILVEKGIISHIGEYFPKDELSKKATYNGDFIRQNLPAINNAQIIYSYYENSIYNYKLFGVFGNAGFTQKQNTKMPKMLIIQNGVTDIAAIYDSLNQQGIEGVLTKNNGVYHLNKPLIISNGATLVITGDDVKELRLSTQNGAYLINVGDLHISDTKITAWDDDNDKPMWAVYKDKRKFRPFFTAWSRSNSFIGNSELTALGYANGKSYGISFSAGPNEWLKMGNNKYDFRPTGIITDNSFNNALYGFYSYEADDVVLNGNEYIDNIVYGIDPHDRSRRLVIAYNTAYNTFEKHGIIISREVNDSLILGNLSFANKGTGIMIDRDSNGTLIYANTAFNNTQEGMTLFESDCAIIAANNLFDNKGAGVRIRNSYNVGLFYNNISGNNAGIIAYTAKLTNDPVHSHRDFELDPYDVFTTFTAVGNVIQSNYIGIVANNMDALFLKDTKFIDQSPKLLGGKWFEQNPEILFRHNQDKYGLIINSACPTLNEPLIAQACKFRDRKTLYGDGQDNLLNRVAKSQCAKGVQKKNIKQGSH